MRISCVKRKLCVNRNPVYYLKGNNKKYRGRSNKGGGFEKFPKPTTTFIYKTVSITQNCDSSRSSYCGFSTMRGERWGSLQFLSNVEVINTDHL